MYTARDEDSELFELLVLRSIQGMEGFLDCYAEGPAPRAHTADRMRPSVRAQRPAAAVVSSSPPPRPAERSERVW